MKVPFLCLLLIPTIMCISRTELNTNNIYEGVMQPDNIIVGIIQNFYNFLTSTIGWLIIMPFYQSTNRAITRVRRLSEEDSPPSPSLPLTPEKMTWILRRLAHTAEEYTKEWGQ